MRKGGKWKSNEKREITRKMERKCETQRKKKKWETEKKEKNTREKMK